MINGAHFVIYSQDPEADRAFIRDVLGFSSVDVGGGWLIFALPPSEIAVHPASRNFGKRQGGHSMLATVLYLMCDDLPKVVKSLEAKKAECSGIGKEPWGVYTTVMLPSGAEIGLYQPSHKTAHSLKAE
ncbi:MAG: extradiol dioxygenase [Terriglobia bacterium]|jgi:hypothetical protein